MWITGGGAVENQALIVDVDWREYLLRQLGAIAPCVRNDASCQIDLAFALYAPFACNDAFLAMLYAKRHLLSYLIALYSSRVNYYDARSTDTGTFKRDARSQANDQTVSVSQSTRQAASLGRSAETSQGRSESATTSNDYNLSRSVTAQQSESDDVGRGENESRSVGRSRENSSSQEDGSSLSVSSSYAGDWDITCQFYLSQDSTRSNTQPFVVISRSYSGGSEWMNSRAARYRDDTANSRSRDLYTSVSRDESQDTSQSYSFYNAQQDSRAYSSASSVTVGRGQTDSDSRQRDRGFAWNIAESRSTTKSSGTTTGRGRSESQSESDGVTVSRSLITSEDLSDIARHLIRMMDNNERDIAEYLNARNRMIFAWDYIKRYVEAPLLMRERCAHLKYRPFLVKGDPLLMEVRP
jgi:hypothetical protein